MRGAVLKERTIKGTGIEREKPFFYKMGQVSISAFGCVVSIVLLLQLGLHTQLLQRNSVGISSYGNLTDNSQNQYLDGTSPLLPTSHSLFSSSRIISAINSNSRYKRFLQRLHHDKRTSEEVKDFFDDFVIIPSKIPFRDNQSEERNAWEGVNPSLTIKNFYTGDFLLPNAPLCNKSQNLTLVVLIPSAVSHFKQRDSVRRTWGSFALRKDVAIGFVVGDPDQSQVSSSELEPFEQEMDLFQDIIIANFKDSYRNLTLKTLYMLEWTSTYCGNAKYFMKTDDDVFLNIPLILEFIAKIETSDAVQPKIYGNVFSGHLPQRNTSHKHFVNYKVYPHEVHYPNFTSGPSYLISTKILKPLLNEAIRLPLFNLEDVLLTGFVASALNIPRINVTMFRNELENPFDMPACKIVKTIAGMTDGSPAQIYHVWYNYLMGTVICKHLKKRR